jgi:hypothetical protein
MYHVSLVLATEQEYGTSVDMWSLGVCIYILLGTYITHTLHTCTTAYTSTLQLAATRSNTACAVAASAHCNCISALPRCCCMHHALPNRLHHGAQVG